MVLCPFVYLIMRYDTPPLDLQPAEVHSTHWVSLASLLSPSLRTSECADISARAVRQRNPVIRILARVIIGQMVFSAVRLKPSESIMCSAAPTAIQTTGDKSPFSTSGLLQAFPFWVPGIENPLSHERSLLLWGLTLGIMADLLENIDHKGTAKLWSWPTFSHPDTRLFVWILTRKLRSQRLRELETLNDSTFNPSQVRTGGVDSTTTTTSVLGHGMRLEPSNAGAHRLEGYFEQMKKAVILALGVRLSVGTLVVAILIRRLARRLRR